MKNTLLLALGALAALLMALALCSASYRCGIRHALTDSIIYTTERYDPNDPDENATDGYDLTIYIELDGNTYAHGMIQG